VIIFRLALRQLMSGRRWLVLCVIAAFPPLLSLLARSAGASADFIGDGFPDIVVGVIVPIITLLLAGSVFASDFEEGTAVFVLAKPIARSRILLERFAATVVLSIVLAVLSVLASILVHTGRMENVASVMMPYGVAVAFGAALYSALFLSLSLITRRGIIVGLLYVLIWESALAAQFAGTRSLSVKEYMLTIASALDSSGLALHTTTVTTPTALGMGMSLGVLAIVYALHKLRNYELAEQG
jgi:ABC-2 type transport system permease protein